MIYNELYNQIVKKKSFLCVGLDSEYDKIPGAIKLAGRESALSLFNAEIIDATASYAVAYKINTAFYEALGSEGVRQMEKTAEYIKTNYPDIFLIADAKRGDIGNTAKQYAKAFFERMPFDAVTLSPYMGGDAIAPFLEYKDKWAIILAITSNGSATDFETLKTPEEPLYERVIKQAKKWGNSDNIMFVVGATRPEILGEIRKLAPKHFFLVPGVGAQGGDLQQVAKFGLNDKCGLLVNSSRGIIFADSTENFAEVAGKKARDIAIQMAKLLKIK